MPASPNLRPRGDAGPRTSKAPSPGKPQSAGGEGSRPGVGGGTMENLGSRSFGKVLPACAQAEGTGQTGGVPTARLPTRACSGCGWGRCREELCAP